MIQLVSLLASWQKIVTDTTDTYVNTVSAREDYISV